MVEHRAGVLDPVFVGLSLVGYAGLVWIAIAPLLALWAKRPLVLTTAVTAACVWTSDLLATGLKAAVDRPRPSLSVAQADPLLGGTLGSSFPSGHAATSFAGAVLLAFLVGRAAPVLFVLAAAVAFSRVYVGVHYPLDVLGGAALGTAVALASAAILRNGTATARLRSSGARRRSGATPPPG